MDFEADLDLGSRRKPTEWVAVAPPMTIRNKQNPQKRNNGRRRATGQEAVKPPESAQPPKESASQKSSRARYSDKPPELAQGVHARSSDAELLEAESDEGNVEYKLRLKDPNPVRFQQLVTQMKFRLSEGNGECFYYVGVEDDGYPRGLSPTDLAASLVTLRAMATAVDAAITPLREMPACKGRAYAIVRVHRLCLEELSYTDLRIAVAGSVDSGKSTLVAVLTQGQKGRPLLDDGQGSARMAVLKHKHEIESGRTSSLSHHMLAYDAEARVLNYAGVAPLMPSEIADAASKVLRFVDLGGHQKYLKTALYGMTSLLPDHVLLCICPLAGMTRITREHLAVALALELPVAIVLTKVDIAPPAAVQAVLGSIQQLLSSAASGSPVTGADEQPAAAILPYKLVASESQNMLQAMELAKGATKTGVSGLKPIPVFPMSSTTGTGLSVLHAFLSHLEPAYAPSCADSRPSTAASQPPASEEPGAPHLPGTIGAPLGSRQLEPALQHSDVGVTGSLNAGREGNAAVSQREASEIPLQLLSIQEEAADTAYREPQGASRVSARVGADGVSHSRPATSNDNLTRVSYSAAGRPGESPPGAPAHFQVDQTFEVRGVGSVMSGTVVAGNIVLGQHLLLGPTAMGTFVQVVVTSIQRAQVPVRRIRMGQHATLAIHAAATAEDSDDMVGSSSLHNPASALPAAVMSLSLSDPSSRADLLHSSSPEGYSRMPHHMPANSPLADFKHDSWRENAPAEDPLPPLEQADIPLGSDGGSGAVSFNAGEALAQAPDCIRGHGGESAESMGREDQEADFGEAAVKAPSKTLPVPVPAMLGSEGQGGASIQKGQLRAMLGGSPAMGLLSNTGADLLGGGSDDDGLVPWSEQAGQVASSSNSRKGAVLLDPVLAPRAVWQFEAVMVLLSGFWPPRGLLSGHWPPQADSDTEASDSSLAAGSPASADRLRSPLLHAARQKHSKAAYTPVVHCGSVRQAARVVHMAELPLEPNWSVQEACELSGCNLAPAIAAAATLLAHSSSHEGQDGESSCIAHVTFHFVHRPEWLQEGARLVVRDRTDSCTAGAGVVRSF